MAPIPAPAERPKLDDYPRDERARYYQDLDAWWAATEGLELVGRVGEPLDGIIDPQDQFDLLQFCSECCAGGSPLGEPVRGLDSHRDRVRSGASPVRQGGVSHVTPRTDRWCSIRRSRARAFCHPRRW